MKLLAYTSLLLCNAAFANIQLNQVPNAPAITLEDLGLVRHTVSASMIDTAISVTEKHVVDGKTVTNRETIYIPAEGKTATFSITRGNPIWLNGEFIMKTPCSDFKSNTPRGKFRISTSIGKDETVITCEDFSNPTKEKYTLTIKEEPIDSVRARTKGLKTDQKHPDTYSHDLLPAG